MDLRLNLDTTTFDQLVELGRSSIPGVAPDWTDHNAHDPGIMLMELVAWIAEAQIYSLSRLRRDERLAYAALLGVTPRPPAFAQALIWPLLPEDGGQPTLFAEANVGKGTTATPDSANPPRFHVSREIHVTGAVLQRLLSRSADGRITDQTRANGPNGATYLPFGPNPSPGDSLVLTLKHAPAVGAFTPGSLSLGVELATPSVAEEGHDAAPETPAVRLRVSLRDSAGERPVPLVEDSTGGLLRSGFLLLDLSGETFVDADFELILRSVTGRFLRTPRVRRIALNVLPVEQVEAVVREEAPEFGEGMPDQTYRLIRAGLIDPGALQVVLIEPSGAVETWTAVADFSTCGPESRVFVFDPTQGEVTFGNGLNGMAPPAGAALQVSYDVTAGAMGAVPAGAGWKLRGFAATYGINREVAEGGRDGDVLGDLQSRARVKMEARVASVTSADMAAGATSYADLAVARAFEMKPTGRGQPGTRVLVALAEREGEGADAAIPETAEWLAELRARLAPSLPLGQKLRVVGPAYVEVRVTARLTAATGADVAAIRNAAVARLGDRLKIIDPATGGWAFGRSLTAVMAGGWLRSLPGVVRVDQVRLYRAGVLQAGPLTMGPRELPQLVIADGDIVVQPAQGRASR